MSAREADSLFLILFRESTKKIREKVAQKGARKMSESVKYKKNFVNLQKIFQKGMDKYVFM